MDSSESVNTPLKFRLWHKLILLGVIGLTLWCAASPPTWGFYGHRKINYMAVFTLPVEMVPFFKHHIGYVSEHAVDPDVRRYATEYEAVRHYIDIDHWGEKPFEEVPKDFAAAIAKFCVIEVIETSGDTTLYDFGYTSALDSLKAVEVLKIDSREGIEAFERLLRFIESDVQYSYYEEEWALPHNAINGFSQVVLTDESKVKLIDRFSSYGILPFYLQEHYRKLVGAFKAKDESRILNLAADMGHYLGDAHVPLHTTENYNGQLTNQLGIHAFWESRIPELQADKTYDFFVGKATYIRDKQTYFWNIVEESHRLVADVLRIEHEVSESFPSDQQYCYDDRLDRNIRIQCPEYALAYEKALDGTIEKRMRESIHAVGSIWYSAWVDAGRPILKYGGAIQRDSINTTTNKTIKARPH